MDQVILESELEPKTFRSGVVNTNCSEGQMRTYSRFPHNFQNQIP